MKRTGLSLIAISVVFTLQAQSLKGRLLAQGQPVSMANILVYGADSTRPAAFLTTDSLGLFHAPLPANGNYSVKTALIGYRVYLNVVTVIGDLDLGDISLQLIASNLQEITVTGRKKLIQKTNNGFIVQTDAILTQAAGTATDLLSSVPTVLVDAEGAVSLRGKAPNLLINGRNSTLTKDLNRIPASSIERIEVINNPGARYDADGEGGIINIVLKKNAEAGTNGAFAVAGGRGARERFNTSLLLNHKAGKVNLGMGYDNRYAWRTRSVNTDRETFNADKGHYLEQSRFDDRTEQTHNLKFNADYSGKRDDISFEGIFGYEKVRNLEPLYTRSYSRDRIFEFGNLRTSDENPVERNWEGNLNYVHRFAKEKKILSASLAHSFGNEEENTLITTTPINEKGEFTGGDFLQRTRNKERSNITTGRADMVFPLNRNSFLETGYKGIFRNILADFTNSYQSNGSFIKDPRYSNIFDFWEQIHAIYGTYRRSAGRWKYEAGLRLEQMNNKGVSDNPDSSFTNAFLNFFPSLNLGYTLSDGSQLKINLGRRINRPGLGQLNPFIDITDSLNRHGGNPTLRPELVNTAELGWSKDWRALGFTVNAFYRRGTHTILPYTILLPGGIALTQPQNVGSSATMGMEGFITASAGKIWNSTASVSLYGQRIRGMVKGDDLQSDLFTWYVKWANSFNIGSKTKAQVLFNYQAPTALPQGRRAALYNTDLGVQHKLMKGRARLGMTVTDLFNTLRNGNTLLTDEFRIVRTSKSDTRAVLLTFAMTFGSAFREKLMENKFSPE